MKKRGKLYALSALWWEISVSSLQPDRFFFRRVPKGRLNVALFKGGRVNRRWSWNEKLRGIHRNLRTPSHPSSPIGRCSSGRSFLELPVSELQSRRKCSPLTRCPNEEKRVQEPRVPSTGTRTFRRFPPHAHLILKGRESESASSDGS